MSQMLSVQAAASRLGVNAQRVRALIAEDRLPAQRVGRDYVLDSGAVAAFARLPRVHGRPLSARNAWRLLAMLSGIGDEGSAPDRSRDRLRALLRRGGDAVVKALVHSQPRSENHEWRVLPFDLERLLDDPTLVRSGLAANSGLINVRYDPSRDGLDAYVGSDDLSALRQRLQPSPSVDAANVLLRVPVESSWILGDEVQGSVPPAVAAADLLRHQDERVRRAGESALVRIAHGD
jgi:excisionase family DNA binding protein